MSYISKDVYSTISVTEWVILGSLILLCVIGLFTVKYQSDNNTEHTTEINLQSIGE